MGWGVYEVRSGVYGVRWGVYGEVWGVGVYEVGSV